MCEKRREAKEKSVSTYEDEIALLVEDIKRWAGADSRIQDALEQMVKLYESEVNALAFEALELERAVVRATTERERSRVVAAQPEVRWQEANNQALGW